jgi:hypothetical protein
LSVVELVKGREDWAMEAERRGEEATGAVVVSKKDIPKRATTK